MTPSRGASQRVKRAQQLVHTRARGVLPGQRRPRGRRPGGAQPAPAAPRRRPPARARAATASRILGVDEQRRSRAGLGQRGAVGGHDRRAAGHRLDARQPEALVQRGHARTPARRRTGPEAASSGDRSQPAQRARRPTRAVRRRGAGLATELRSRPAGATSSTPTRGEAPRREREHPQVLARRCRCPPSARTGCDEAQRRAGAGGVRVGARSGRRRLRRSPLMRSGARRAAARRSRRARTRRRSRPARRGAAIRGSSSALPGDIVAEYQPPPRSAAVSWMTTTLPGQASGAMLAGQKISARRPRAPPAPAARAAPTRGRRGARAAAAAAPPRSARTSRGRRPIDLARPALDAAELGAAGRARVEHDRPGHRARGPRSTRRARRSAVSWRRSRLAGRPVSALSAMRSTNVVSCRR